MAYIRKTRDTWQIHVNYGSGWEHECTEFSRKDARDQVKTYRENAPQYPVKIVPKREAKTVDDAAIISDVFASHRRRDPHCSCSDCIAYMEANTEAPASAQGE